MIDDFVSIVKQANFWYGYLVVIITNIGVLILVTHIFPVRFPR